MHTISSPWEIDHLAGSKKLYDKLEKASLLGKTGRGKNIRTIPYEKLALEDLPESKNDVEASLQPTISVAIQNTFFRNMADERLHAERHLSSGHQEAYDKKFGIVGYK